METPTLNGRLSNLNLKVRMPLKIKVVVISEWYDYEQVSAFTVTCDCGAEIPEESLFTEGVHVCECGIIIELHELDKLADAMISPIPHVDD
jgi:hypothetical protein